MSNIERAKMYDNLKWTMEQFELLSKTFNHLDYLMLLCEKERNMSKLNVLKQAHQTIHDIVLSNGLKDIIKDISIEVPNPKNLN